MDHFEAKVDNLKVIIFDLDYTLWPFWVDTHVTPPFKLVGDKVYDRCKHQVKHYPEVPEVLNKLKSLGYELAIASRTSATDDAESLLQLFNWNQYFTYKEIYPGMKTKHISSICKDSGAKYDQLLFFDDEHRNIRDLTAINVCSILVENGVNLNTIQHGIDTFLNQMR